MLFFVWGFVLFLVGLIPIMFFWWVEYIVRLEIVNFLLEIDLLGVYPTEWGLF